MDLAGVIRGTNFSITAGEEFKGLVQSFSLQFQKRMQRVYDLTDGKSFYYVEGPSEGNVDFSKVVGPKGAPKLACSCVPEQITLNAGSALCYQTNAGGSVLPASDANYKLKNCYPFGLRGQGEAGNALIVFSISYLFSGIE
jgi:hypothetical protein